MTFWDTSAIVPLLVAEDTSEAIRVLAHETALIVWWGTATECLSALARRERENVLSADAVQFARERLRWLRQSWNEILPSEQVRQNAERLLLRHPLRAADAFQLGAALRWAENQPNGHQFLALDQRLTEAARREGFILVRPL